MASSPVDATGILPPPTPGSPAARGARHRRNRPASIWWRRSFWCTAPPPGRCWPRPRTGA